MTGDAEVSAKRQLEPFTLQVARRRGALREQLGIPAHVAGERHRVRHSLGGREVFGRWRVYTVTWLDGEVQVEGLEADDYLATQALLSRLRNPVAAGRRAHRPWAVAVLFGFPRPGSRYHRPISSCIVGGERR